MADGERIHTFFLSPPTHRTRGWFLSTHSRVACSSVGRNNVMLCYVMLSKTLGYALNTVATAPHTTTLWLTYPNKTEDNREKPTPCTMSRWRERENVCMRALSAIPDRRLSWFPVMLGHRLLD